MASIVPGFEYDIFISYRHNDNRSGWVTEFVSALQEELAATLKEPVSVYFDTNPHDGLLETHNVDKSLEGKLKCLIFIPIISQTYCDSKCFAWEHEFAAFNKMAKEDQFGRDIRLGSGNVASRILPVKIHDLDTEDKTLLENELGGFIRGIEFIYKEPGVNRPLKSEDDEKKNLNSTKYLNQINKVANAVKEIITALKKQSQHPEEVIKQDFELKPAPKKNLRTKIIAGTLILLALVVIGYFFIPKLFKPAEQLEKSIAVLPFINDSPNDSTTYFMDGVMEEILTNLQTVKDLRVISRSSVEQYRKQNKSIPEIAKEQGVNYILVSSGQKSGNIFRLRVKLIRASKESQLLARNYEQENPDAKDYFRIQSQIAQEVASQLEAVITPQEKRLIEKTHTANLEAYNAYLKGEFYRMIETKNDLETSMRYYKIALEKDSDYALAYCGIAFIYEESLEMGYISPSEGIPKAYAALMTARKLDSTLAEVHYGLAMFKTYSEWDWKGGESEFKKAIIINPNYAEALAYYSLLLNRLGRTEEAMEQIKLALKLTPYDPLIMDAYGWVLLKAHRYNEAIAVGREALKIDSISGLAVLEFTLHLTGRHDEALKIWKKVYYVGYPGFVHAFDQGYSKAGYIGALSFEADTLFAQSKTAYVNPGDIAILYVCAGNKKRALDFLERAFEVHDVNLCLIPMPIFDILRNEPRFQALSRKINLPYE